MVDRFIFAVNVSVALPTPDEVFNVSHDWSEVAVHVTLEVTVPDAVLPFPPLILSVLLDTDNVAASCVTVIVFVKLGETATVTVAERCEGDKFASAVSVSVALPSPAVVFNTSHDWSDVAVHVTLEVTFSDAVLPLPAFILRVVPGRVNIAASCVTVIVFDRLGDTVIVTVAVRDVAARLASAVKLSVALPSPDEVFNVSHDWSDAAVQVVLEVIETVETFLLRVREFDETDRVGGPGF